PRFVLKSRDQRGHDALVSVLREVSCSCGASGFILILEMIQESLNEPLIAKSQQDLLLIDPGPLWRPRKREDGFHNRRIFHCHQSLQALIATVVVAGAENF